MKIGIIGYGKMGKMIEQVALGRGHKISEIIDPMAKTATSAGLTTEGESDVYIDFSTPAAIGKTIHAAINLNKNIVVGTTGWLDAKDEIALKVGEAEMGFVWASNFSPAVQMFFRVVRQAAKIANNLPNVDAAVTETHHKHKHDAPSGTALTTARVMLDELDRKTELLTDLAKSEPIRSHQLQISSLRLGETVGEHTAYFDSPSETISVNCSSRSRDGYALGAVLAAEWLFGKQGFYCFDDVFEEVLQSTDVQK
jgi:4-hydroxy-tetrahydrodipicolinate reductase